VIDLNESLGVLTSDGAARELRFERRLKQPPAKVWAALTDPERIMAWLYAKDVVVEPRVGGLYRLHFTNSDHRMDNVVTRFEPPTVFEHSFGAPDSIVTWTLAPDGEGTRLTLVHRLEAAQHGMVLQTLSGWHDILVQLETRLDGRPRAWDFGVWDQYRRRYAEAHGDDDRAPADLSDRDGEAELRFERLLNHAPAKVWAALTDPERLPMWFAELDPNVAVGATFPIRFPHAPGVKSQGRLTAFEPERLLAFEWDGRDQVRFELSPEREGTRLVLTHRTPERGQAAGFAAGWHVHLDALMRLLNTGKPTPIRPDQALEAYYTARFGLGA
jgi:uncharacterized protein YndB with AHSA1/START domain